MHWSFLFNSEASLLEGNRIQDNGLGAANRFTTIATVQGYSPLDQYLMGFRTPDEVPPTFLVSNSPQIANGSLPPQVGVFFDGDRRDIRVQDVIDVVGRRTPDSSVAQRQFRLAFVLIVPAGSTVDPGVLAQVETYRAAFADAYSRFASGRATVDPTLKRAVQLSVSPAAGVIAGGSGSASVTVDTAATASLDIALRPASGLIGAPATVTIPAGSKSVTFSIAGISEGVDQLVATPSDAGYETVTANIQVARADGLKLSVINADPRTGPVVVRLSDVNQLPYPGVRLTAAVSGGGSAEAAALTDQSGSASFHWTTGAGPVNQMVIAVAGGPSVTITAAGPPQFAAAAVVNAASFVPGLCAGSIETVFGSNLAGASVAVNGVVTQVFYSDSGQINFLTPVGVGTGTATLTVQNGTGAASAQVPVVAYQPGIFAAAARSGVAEIYATGLGPLNGQNTSAQAVVSIGGMDAPVLYSGIAPGFVGLYQVDAMLPAGATAGSAVSMIIGGRQSNTVSLR